MVNWLSCILGNVRAVGNRVAMPMAKVSSVFRYGNEEC